MNKERRKDLAHAVDILSEAQGKIQEARDIVDTAYNDESEYRDNMPENLQESDKYYAAEEACNALESALESLDELDDTINDIIGGIDEASS